MKEIPMLFSAPMIRALLDGRKTQTRRLKFNGAVGDLIWVRETWAASHAVDAFPPREIPHLERIHYAATANLGAPVGLGGLLTRVAIHMPRWMSRIQLRVTAVRSEPLESISESDAMAEGAKRFDDIPDPNIYRRGSRWSMETPATTDECLHTARFAFGNFWKKINGEDSWYENPTVFVIEFERVK